MSVDAQNEESKQAKKNYRLREKSRVDYSEATIDVIAKINDEDQMKLEEEFENDEAACVCADLDPYSLTPLEKQQLPQLMKCEAYFQVRNHILGRWQSNLSVLLSEHQAMKEINEKYKPLVPCVYEFLRRFGFINAGITHPYDDSLRNMNPKKYRVLIIGAGMSGLASARQLDQFGFDVTVLEARNRVGGRVQSDYSFGEKAVDLGASIITGLEGNPLTNVCRQLNLSLCRLSGECPIFDVDGSTFEKNFDQHVEETFNNLLEEANNRKQEFPDSLGVAFDSLLEQQSLDDKQRRLLNWHVANLEYGCAAELSKVSLKYWDQDDSYEWAGDHCLIPDGYSCIAESLAKGLNVIFNSTVERIEYDPNMTLSQPARVHTREGKIYEAEVVLVTVPLGVLKTGAIQFSPSLPQEKQKAIQNLGFGLLNKVILLFPRVFWDDSVDYFGQTREESDEKGEFYIFWNLHKCTGKPILVSLMAGKAAHDSEKLATEVLLQRVFNLLKKKFGEDIPQPLKAERTCWASDPFALGTYSFVGVGSSGSDYDVLRKPLGNLFFAGEATERNHPATAAGAYLSGLRTAGSIVTWCYGPIKVNVDLERINRLWEKDTPRKRSRSKWLEREHDFESEKELRAKNPRKQRKTRLHGALSHSAKFSWLFESYKIPKKMKSNENISMRLTTTAYDATSSFVKSEDIQQTVKQLVPQARRFDIKPTIQHPPKHSTASNEPTPDDLARLYMLNRQIMQASWKVESKQPQTIVSSAITQNPPPRVLNKQQIPLTTTSSKPFQPPNEPPHAFYPQTQVEQLDKLQRIKEKKEQLRLHPNYRRIKAEVSEIVVKNMLNYLKSGRIQSKDDFKYLARKLTHKCIVKYLGLSDLDNATMDTHIKNRIMKYVNDHMTHSK